MRTDLTTRLQDRLLRRRRARNNGQRGMTLLEIMIVLAILALVMGFVVGPRIYAAFKDSKEEIQRAKVRKIVYEGFVQWATKNPTKACPGSLGEVVEFIGQKETTDAWGHEMIMFCGDSLPPGAAQYGFAVLSFGPDGQQNTSDDIKSWD